MLFSNDLGYSQEKNRDEKDIMGVRNSQDKLPLPASDSPEEIIATDGVGSDSLLSDDWISEEVKLKANLDRPLVMPMY